MYLIQLKLGLQIYDSKIGDVKCFAIYFLLLYLQKIFRDVAQPGSVLAWGARGRWFESSHPDFFLFLNAFHRKTSFF